MTPRAELCTARLSLRPLGEMDEAAVLAVLNDLSVTGWLAVVPHPYTAADFHQFLAAGARPGETWAVHDDAGLAGVVGAGQRLGYWFAPRAHGKGYATEAARAILAEQLACDPTDVASGYFEGNLGSARVLEKLGFVKVGCWPAPCRALGVDRPHVELRLTKDAFVAALPIEARSTRMTYRSLQATDLEALHGIVSHHGVVRNLASWPWPPDPAFTRTRAWPYTGPGFVWGAFLDGRLAGTVGVGPGGPGCMFAPEFWGRGLAHEACSVAITRAFGASGDHLMAEVWEDNTASLALAARLGFCTIDVKRAVNEARGEMMSLRVLRLERADWPGAGTCP